MVTLQLFKGAMFELLILAARPSFSGRIEVLVKGCAALVNYRSGLAQSQLSKLICCQPADFSGVSNWVAIG